MVEPAPDCFIHELSATVDVRGGGGASVLLLLLHLLQQGRTAAHTTAALHTQACTLFLGKVPPVMITFVCIHV